MGSQPLEVTGASRVSAYRTLGSARSSSRTFGTGSTCSPGKKGEIRDDSFY